MFGFISFFLLVSIVAAMDTILVTCEVDEDCMLGQIFNQYCYEGRECVNCTDCGVYSRFVNYGVICAKSVNDCGRCFKGYLEAGETTDDTKLPCIKEYSEYAFLRVIYNVPIFWLITAVFFIFMAIFLIVIIVKWELCKNALFVKVSSMVSMSKKNPNTIHLETGEADLAHVFRKEPHPSAPPPILRHIPIVHENTRIRDGEVQFANVFQYPSYISAAQGCVPSDIGSDADTLLQMEGVDFDDSTQPSEWIPNIGGNNNGEQISSISENSQSSFVGVISRSISQNRLLDPTQTDGRNFRIDAATNNEQVPMRRTQSSQFVNNSRCSTCPNVEVHSPSSTTSESDSNTSSQRQPKGDKNDTNESYAQTNAQPTNSSQSEPGNSHFRNHFNNAIVLNNIISFSNNLL